ncbi:MAG: hypothetical protein ABI472_10085 [Ginsengibacter sp.]
MKIALKLIILLFIEFAFFSSCQKVFSPMDNGGDSFVYDPDAKRFIDSSGITDSIQKITINHFVIQLKDSFLWTKFKAIYPMAGGTANTTKWNLKDPRNLDVAYRLTFNGSPVFASSGVLFPTTSDFADTHLADSAIGAYNDAAISYYSMTQNAISAYDMGCIEYGIPFNEFAIYHEFDVSVWFGYRSSFGIAPLNTKGLFMLSSTETDVKRFENGVVTDSKGSAPSPEFTNMPVLIGTVAAAPTAAQRECALATIGNGLTDAQALTFYTIVKNFQTELGR